MAVLVHIDSLRFAVQAYDGEGSAGATAVNVVDLHEPLPDCRERPIAVGYLAEKLSRANHRDLN